MLTASSSKAKYLFDLEIVLYHVNFSSEKKNPKNLRSYAAGRGSHEPNRLEDPSLEDSDQSSTMYLKLLISPQCVQFLLGFCEYLIFSPLSFKRNKWGSGGFSSNLSR